ncbi:DeoR/GlpR family DNA-binding transcription regulator [Amycolatopsis taiwanensis]|uniref:DeoR/GlpR family DNA-binding transcription regulator n=1 Tax=Amycolatopsis taiwanensis TaxID=342230 RepID=UPI0004845D56|nr:DeoR/GlpR family DNA-binding transcription regulator [Amycolatopsis taiwanensis]
MAIDAGERQQLIRERVAAEGEVEFAGLATDFGVSEMTIRRDIDVLESEGLVRKVIGGAIAVGKTAEPPFEARANSEAAGKRHIAEAVVTRLRPRETVLLDSGSTALAVARAIRGKGLELTVVTPSILVAVELAVEPGTSVLLAGGLVRAGELSLIGADAIEFYDRYNCDTFVMGVAGVDAKRGFSDYHREESAVKRAAIRAADRLIVAADHTKLGHAHLVNIAPLSAADVLVTDGDPRHEAVTAAADSGVEIVAVAARS